MKFEYHNGDLTLKILNTDATASVLDFYARNRAYFDPYETEKPAQFYTYHFIHALLVAEYNSFLSGKHARYFLFDANIPDQILGTVSFSDIKNGNFNSCTIGYKIDAAFQRKGYGRRMLTQALKCMVTDAHMHRIEAYIAPDNTASIALVKELGFLSEGIAYSYVYINGRRQDYLRYVYIS